MFTNNIYVFPRHFHFCKCYFVPQDLVVHVRDISHPECGAQLEDVLTVLEKQLSLKAPLIDNMIEVQNKADLWYV